MSEAKKRLVWAVCCVFVELIFFTDSRIIKQKKDRILVERYVKLQHLKFKGWKNGLTSKHKSNKGLEIGQQSKYLAMIALCAEGHEQLVSHQQTTESRRLTPF